MCYKQSCRVLYAFMLHLTNQRYRTVEFCMCTLNPEVRGPRAQGELMMPLSALLCSAVAEFVRAHPFRCAETNWRTRGTSQCHHFRLTRKRCIMYHHIYINLHRAQSMKVQYSQLLLARIVDKAD